MAGYNKEKVKNRPLDSPETLFEKQIQEFMGLADNVVLVLRPEEIHSTSIFSTRFSVLFDNYDDASRFGHHLGIPEEEGAKSAFICVSGAPMRYGFNFTPSAYQELQSKIQSKLVAMKDAPSEKDNVDDDNDERCSPKM